MVFQTALPLVLASSLAVACAAEQDAPTYATITGSVHAESGEPLSGATVRLEIDRKLETTTTRSDGSFELELDQGEYEALPENFFVVVTHANYAANAIELRRSDSDESEGEGENSSIEQELGVTSRPLAEQAPTAERIQGPRRVVLRPTETVAASTYTVTDALAHLGNSEYEGSANSRFQLKQASGESLSYAFQLANFDASRFPRAAVRLYARGVQSPNEIYLNGALAGTMPLTPENGQAELIQIELSPTAFVSGQNELRLSAALGDYTDVDDFEYAFVEVVFYTGATVDDVARDTKSCSTDAVEGLTRQIIEQLACIAASGLAELDHEQLVLERTAYRWAQPALRDALADVLATLPDRTMTLNSTLRSIAQQYLLRRQLDAKRCGRTLVN